ncbi:MAG: hypothetical protein HRT37_24445 [Alteromonadaceae bacterium]|nr:hypothetical protein [Alteromonadaceae bacterium]
MKLRIFIIMSLTVLLPSSSFFLDKYLDEIITSGDFSARQLQLAVKLELNSALIIQRQTAIQGSDLWKRLSQKLAKNDGKIAFELAAFYHKVNRQQVNNQQVKDNYIEEDLQQNIITWYQQAIRLNYQPAYIEFAKYYFNAGKLEIASEILKPLLENNQALNLSIEIAVSQGDIDFVDKHFDQLKKFADNNQSEPQKNSKKIVNLLERYQVSAQQRENQETKFNSCNVSVQLFATNFYDLTYIEKQVTEFASHPLNQYLCFPPIRYVKLSQLECSHFADERIQCRESQWKNLAGSIQSRYLGILLPRGGANVNNGILYLDRQDTVQVLAHELSHLLGFIDEYPLPVNHSVCVAPQKRMFSHNIVVLNSVYQGKRKEIRPKILKQVPWFALIKDTTPILLKVKQGWRLGTPESFAGNVGLYLSETCDNQKVQAFKPLYQHTQLRYFEQYFPVEYVTQLNENLTKFLMPSFHYNIALSLLVEGEELEGEELEGEARKLNLEQAQSLLKQAAITERNAFRH